MKLITCISFAMLALFLHSCAGTAEGYSKKVSVASVDEKNEAIRDISNPKGGKTRVYFLRIDEDGPDIYAMTIWINRQIVAKIKQEDFTYIDLPPGKHELQVSWTDKMIKDNTEFLKQLKKSTYSNLKSFSKILYVPLPRRGPISQTVGYYYANKKINYLGEMKYGSDDIRKLISDYDYIPNANISIDSTFASDSEKREWNDISNSTNVAAFDTYISSNPSGPFLEQAKLKKNELVEYELQYFEDAKKADSLTSYNEYLLKFPNAHNKSDALKLMVRKISANSDYQKYAKIHNGIVAYFPREKRMAIELLNLGPNDMKISEILSHFKDGIGTGTLSAKIKATNASYKDFSIAEIKYLKNAGLHEKLIEAMIETNTEHHKQMKLARQNKNMMDQIQKLIQSSQAKVNTSYKSAAKGEDKNLPLECIKLKAALSACDKTSGLLAFACKTTARSSFSCNVKI